MRVEAGHRPRTGLVVAATAGLVATVAVVLIVQWRQALGSPGTFQDLAVYRAGGAAIAAGTSPYGAGPDGHGDLVFTYPPFAAVLFQPVSWMPLGIAQVTLTALSVAAYLIVVLTTARRLRWNGWVVGVAVLAGLIAAPVFRTVQQGQLNLVLVALVVVDVWVLPRPYRGVLIGLAAGVKIVPGVFLLYFVAQRDWASAARASAVGLGTIALAWVVAPGASTTYWTQMVFDTSRSGGGGYPDNQSLTGLLARVLQDDAPPTWLVLPLQVGVLVLAYVVARRAHAAERQVDAVLAVAVGGLLASPVSWSHHWVWCVPLVMTLADRGSRAAAAAAAAVFLVPPLAVSRLGWLEGTPSWLWVSATTLYLGVGLAWLLTTSTARNIAGPGRVEPDERNFDPPGARASSGVV
ncbi:MAG: glycosyltransferase 87 family protein [Phycicoccus sp.]